jgi:hypothetical protein
MDSWIASGWFLLGAGAGALTTFALPVEQIRQLKDPLEAARNKPQKEDREQCQKPEGRKSA